MRNMRHGFNGTKFTKKNNDLIAEMSIKFKSQLNFKCKSIC